MKWLVVFPDTWLAFSPSCLNFSRMLQEYGHECLILYPDEPGSDNSKVKIPAQPVKISKGTIQFFAKLRLGKLLKIAALTIAGLRIRRKFPYQRVVGIDDVGFIAARILDSGAIYYSLEIYRNSYNRLIEAVMPPELLITQTRERGDYLFPSCNNVAFLQNSPILCETPLPHNDFRGRLIYFGNLINGHGVENCIRTLYASLDISLVVKGISESDPRYVTYLRDKYRSLEEAGRLKFDFSYIEDEDIPRYLADFDIGFCLYDVNAIARSYNYESSPSGKVFNYFLAGLPVIANNVVGMQPIAQFDAGILLDTLEPELISEAIEKIRHDYSRYSSNACEASSYFDYRRMFGNASTKILDHDDGIAEETRSG